MSESNGFILYQGPSLLDGSPVVCIVIGTRRGSSNRKTGAMLQTYIIRADVAPMDALRSGQDAAICGDCPLRGFNGRKRACYVNVSQGPTQVYRAFTRNNYEIATDIADVGANRMVRVGTYGDPAAIPAHVWYALLSRSAGHTGYTHQWRVRPDLASIVMASADSAADRDTAHAAGFRTFRIADMPDRGEIVCPSSRGVHCIDCGLCDGAGPAKSITIPAHGIGARFVLAD